MGLKFQAAVNRQSQQIHRNIPANTPKYPSKSCESPKRVLGNAGPIAKPIAKPIRKSQELARENAPQIFKSQEILEVLKIAQPIETARNLSFSSEVGLVSGIFDPNVTQIL